MGQTVVNGASIMCTFGAAPGTLTVLPVKMITNEGQPQATIMDYKPMVNITPFGTCMSIANPTVASATAAALGVLTPMPCIPNTIAPWVVGCTTVVLKNEPALTNSSTCNCMWAGVISITYAGTTITTVPG